MSEQHEHFVVRPALRFDARERWRPLAIGELFAERFPDRRVHRLCRGPRAERCLTVRLRRSSDLDPRFGWLDLVGGGRDGGDSNAPPDARASCSPDADCGVGPSSAIYVHSSNRPATSGGLEWRFGDYWFFYRFNNAGPPRPLPRDSFDHEGDWEGATIISDLDRPTEVQWAQVASHDDVWSYLPGVMRWEGSHPVLYVARGTHASYVRSCAAACKQGIRRLGFVSFPEGDIGGQKRWAANDDGVCAASACVRTLDTGTGLPIAMWPGRWGDTLRANLRREIDLVKAIVAGVIGRLPGGSIKRTVDYSVGGATSIQKSLTDRSPCSPGLQARYQPHSLPYPAPAGPEPCRVAQGYSADSCDRWFGPYVPVLVCNDDELERGLRSRSFDEPATYKVEVISQRDDSLDQATGIAQVGGLPLVSGDIVRISGVALAGTTLYVRTQAPFGLREIRIAELALRDLPGGVATLRVIDGLPGYEFEPGPSVVGGGPGAAPTASVAGAPAPIVFLTAEQDGPQRVRVSIRTRASRVLVAALRRPRGQIVSYTVARVRDGVASVTLRALRTDDVRALPIGDRGLLGRARTLVRR